MGDARADQLLVWKNSNGSIYAATRQATSRHFGPSHRLPAPGVGVADVTGAFGPQGEAIVAWEDPNTNTLIAAGYQLPH